MRDSYYGHLLTIGFVLMNAAVVVLAETRVTNVHVCPIGRLCSERAAKTVAVAATVVVVVAF